MVNFQTLEERQKNYDTLICQVLELLDQKNEAVLFIDKGDIVRYANPSACTLLGQAQTDLLDKPIPFQYKDVPEQERFVIRPDGERRTIQTWSAKIIWQAEQMSVVYLDDITDKNHDPENLKRERNLLQTLIDNIPDIIFVKNSAFEYILGNKAWKQLAGMQAEDEIHGKTDFDIYASEIAMQYRSHDEAVIVSGLPLLNVEEPNVYPDGTQRWSLISKIPYYDPQNRLIGLIGIGRDITEQKQAIARVNSERSLLLTVINHLPDSVYLKDHQHRFILANETLAKIVGVDSNDKMVGKTDFDFFPPELAERYLNDEKEILESGVPLVDREEPIINSEGVWRWFWTTKIPIFRQDGQPEGIIGIGRDITDRIKMEEALENEASHLQSLMDSLPDHVYLKDIHSRYLNANKAQIQFLGLSSIDAMLGRSDFDFLATPAAERSYLEEQEIIRTGNIIVEREEYNPTREGTPKWISATKAPIYDKDGNIIGIVGIGRDITARKTAEQTLEGERLLMRTLIDSIPDTVYVKDQECRKILTNRADLELLGVEDASEVLGKNDFDYYPREMAEKFYADDQSVLHSGQPVIDREELFNDRRGKQHWLLTSKVPLRDSDGKLIGILGIGRDITERKLMQQVLEHERSLLRILIDSLPDNIYIKDEQCRKMISNPADVRYMGFTEEAEVIGKTDFDVFPVEMAEKFYQDDQTVLKTGLPIIDKEEPVYDVDGREHWLQTSKYPLRNDEGMIIGILGIGRDITARKRYEQALRQAYDDLERRVDERTAELAKANAELRSEIAERKRLEEAERKRVMEMEALGATMTDVSAELEITRLLRAVVDRVVALLGADFGELALYDEKRKDLETLVGYYDGVDYCGERTRLGEGALGMVSQSGRPLIIENYATWPQRIRRPKEVRPFTGLYAPLISGKKLMGAIGVGADIGRRTFTQEDQHLIEMFAQQAAIAIQNAHLFSEVKRLAITDTLTGLYNRRHFMERAQNEFERTRRYHTPLSVIMLDLDHFKSVNDTYGHLLGDAVLQNVGKICKDTLRCVDIIGRYGGEEFMVLLPETPIAKTEITAERLRKNIAELVTPSDQGDIRVTVSLGLSAMTESIDSLDTLLVQADRALYLAKGSGRNKVVVSEANTPKPAKR